MADVTNSTLFKNIEGIQNLKDALFVLVKTEWNEAIVNELERGCLTLLHQYGIKTKTITVPGAVEIPFAVKQCWKYYKKASEVKAFITLGCIVRGDTPHFDYVCQSVTAGVSALNIKLPVPVIFGVLTVNNDEQARERIGGKHGHKGEEAAVTAIKMALLKNEFKSGSVK
ncbi:MAG TPA: 6,7-dimethyl-8-ribityllumazine synthase [Chitinophagaceae bacterium]|nr:6,7-dimethyl-8-ribityllumazine synthase [Chitinophagaceae bacterium]